MPRWGMGLKTRWRLGSNGANHTSPERNPRTGFAQEPFWGGRSVGERGNGGGGWGVDFIDVDGDHFIFWAQGIFVAFATGDDVDEVFWEVESGIEDPWLHFGGKACFHADLTACGEDADLILVFDIFHGGILRVDGEKVFGDDLRVSGPAGHGAAVVVFEDPAGGQDEREFLMMFFDLF